MWGKNIRKKHEIAIKICRYSTTTFNRACYFFIEKQHDCGCYSFYHISHLPHHTTASTTLNTVYSVCKLKALFLLCCSVLLFSFSSFFFSAAQPQHYFFVHQPKKLHALNEKYNFFINS